MKNYSPLFHTLYDEKEPVGMLGRGTHYSVLSAVQWTDKRGISLRLPCIQKFAVVWDEDHDIRVIDVIERAYMSGLIAPVLFIGERKACLSVVVDRETYSQLQDNLDSYSKAWQEICSNVGEDVWSFELMTVDDPDLGIIMASTDIVVTYLTNINNLWGLGINPYMHKAKNQALIPPPPTFFK